MEKHWNGFRCIFAFTFRQQAKKKGYRMGTILVALLLFLLPSLLLPLFGHRIGVAEGYTPHLEKIYYVNQSTSLSLDFSVLNSAGSGAFSQLEYAAFTSLEEANRQAEATKNTLLLVTDTEKGQLRLHVLRPKGTAVTTAEAETFESFLSAAFPAVLAQAASLEPTELAQWAEADIQDNAQDEEASPLDTAREIISFALPYLNIMLLYFLILFYGQSVGTCVILEKNSKLMDTFLLSVRPGDMVVGKVLATVCAATIQISAWVLSLFGGCALGLRLLASLHPGESLPLLAIVASLRSLSGMFSLGGVVFSLLLFLGGFLLYCSLAAIGGAMASKPEELSSSNMIFVLVLIASFFLTLNSSMGNAAAWLNWFPFTAILIAPSQVLLGQMTLWAAAGSMCVILVTALLILLLAGKIYKQLALYKGQPLKIDKVLKMLRNQ